MSLVSLYLTCIFVFQTTKFNHDHNGGKEFNFQYLALATVHLSRFLIHRVNDANPSAFVISTLHLIFNELIKNVVSLTDCRIATFSLSTESSVICILNIEIN